MKLNNVQYRHWLSRGGLSRPLAPFPSALIWIVSFMYMFALRTHIVWCYSECVAHVIGIERMPEDRNNHLDQEYERGWNFIVAPIWTELREGGEVMPFIRKFLTFSRQKYWKNFLVYTEILDVKGVEKRGGPRMSPRFRGDYYSIYWSSDPIYLKLSVNSITISVLQL